MTLTLKRSTYILALLTPTLAFAAGGGDSSAPSPTPTTETCTGGQIWDASKNACVDPSRSSLSDDTLYGAVREFAYAGQYDNAQTALSLMSDQSQDRVLTYWGFTHRKMGDVATAMAYYEQAIAANPGNILARSYMGQAFVEAGDLSSARVQLDAIRAENGAGTWAEASLKTAIATGQTYGY